MSKTNDPKTGNQNKCNHKNNLDGRFGFMIRIKECSFISLRRAQQAKGYTAGHEINTDEISPLYSRFITIIFHYGAGLSRCSRLLPRRKIKSEPYIKKLILDEDDCTLSGVSA